MKLLVFILTCLTLASPLKAEEEKIKGTDLYTACTGTPHDQAECRMWIIGFFNGFGLAQIAARQKRLPLACYPDDLTNGQASLIVEKFMRDHPEALHLSAITIAATALALAFPCPDSNR
jgi:Rap1a immunity proteins